MWLGGQEKPALRIISVVFQIKSSFSLYPMHRNAFEEAGARNVAAILCPLCQRRQINTGLTMLFRLPPYPIRGLCQIGVSILDRDEPLIRPQVTLGGSASRYSQGYIQISSYPPLSEIGWHCALPIGSMLVEAAHRPFTSSK